MKEIALTLMIFLLSSCSTQTQTDAHISIDKAASISTQSLQNINDRTETVEVWAYCSDSVKRSEYENCLADELRKLEEKLDAEYSNSLKSTQEYFTSKDVRNLTLAQKIWQSYQEANCQAEKDIYEAGTDAVGAELQCRLRLTKERLEEIKNIYAKK